MNLKKNPEPLKMTNCSTKPWTKIAVDFFGPLPDGSEVLVIKDSFKNGYSTRSEIDKLRKSVASN